MGTMYCQVAILIILLKVLEDFIDILEAYKDS